MVKYYYPQTYSQAREVLAYQSNLESALKELVLKATRDEDLVARLDYAGLRHQYHIISGVAKRILRSEPKDL
nr:hypothetical protein [Nanoarchaeum sp.]